MEIWASSELHFGIILADETLESKLGEISIASDFKIFVNLVAQPGDFSHIFFMNAFSINKLMTVFAFLTSGLV